MRREIDAAGGREVHVVHLGDVYYAGTRWEARHRFLDHWPVRQDEVDQVRSWCLNGNHDMYAAGEGLSDVILADCQWPVRSPRWRPGVLPTGSQIVLPDGGQIVPRLGSSWGQVN